MRSIILPSEALRALLDTGECQHRVPVKVPKWLRAMRPVMEDAVPQLLYGVTPGLKVPCKQWADGTPDEIVERLRNPWHAALVNGVIVDGCKTGGVPVRMYVRETWRLEWSPPMPDGERVKYFADDPTPLPWVKWRSPAVMPAAFSRLTVQLVGLWPKRAPREETETTAAFDWLLTLKRVET